MITFKQYLSEAGTSQQSPRTSPISPENAFELIDKHCSAFAHSMDHQQLFRGGSGTTHPNKCLLGNSNVGEPRRSANTSNYFTWWADNHPDWKNFPKRSRSFICSSDYFTADQYGTAMLFVPYDNAHVGVVPADDLFNAIGSPQDGTLDDENDITRTVLLAVHEEHKDEERPTSYEAFVRQLKLADMELLQRHTAFSGMVDAIKNMKHFKATTYYDVIRGMFNPKDFKEGKASSIKLPRDSEIYVQGEAILLPLFNEGAPPTYDALLDEAKKKYNWKLPT
jgi:hypothetical protein